jgi:hypothetical protein
MKRVNDFVKLLMIALSVTFLVTACEDDPATPKPLAFFTSEADASNSQLIVFTNETDGGDTYSWNFGDGTAASTETSPSHEYAEAGEYTFVLTATNAGGEATHSEAVNVTSAGGVEVVVDGDMSKPESWTNTVLNLTVATTFNFENDAVTITNGNEVNQSNGLIYQAINVEAGDYLFSMDITNDGTQVQTWVQVYFGTIVPTEGDDYEDGGVMSGISSWDGNCPQANTAANIITVACEGALDEAKGGNGVVTFAEAGTIYLAIKAGTWDGNMTTGYVIDNVSLISQ